MSEAESAIAESPAPVKRASNFKDLTGLKFGRITVLSLSSPASRTGSPVTKWNCACACGRQIIIRTSSLKRIKSCGCPNPVISRLANTRHGHSKCVRGKNGSRTYTTYHSMIQRCNNPKATGYARYGGRGIKVCERWLESFENFLADMGERPPGTSIEREEVDGNYEPGNCRWATSKQQRRNTATNRFLEIEGEKLCIMDWSERGGVAHATITHRLNRGWEARRAVFEPVA